MKINNENSNIENLKNRIWRYEKIKLLIDA